MSPTALLPIFTSIALGILTCYFLVIFFGKPSAAGRYASVDGLRGYLALFVFLHHSSVWYFYLRTGHWVVPPSNLYVHLGQSSVALFFMITAFLFFSKIIDGRKSGIDWGRFLVSRFMRLVPLYLLAISIMFIIVAFLSKGTFNEPAFTVFKSAIKWLIFTVLGGPDLNGVNGTAIILAGVTWSLPYEWFFYLALPVLALTTMTSVPIPYLIISGVGMLAFAVHGLSTAILMPFLGGIAASLLVRNDAFCRVARTKTSSAIILACIITTISFYSTAYSPAPILLLSIAFSLIASGNTLFTTLSRPSSRALGEMAYGIYLLHGIVLFIIFTFAIGVASVKEMSQFNYWLLINCLTPALILICFATFKLIESPAMRSSEKVSAWLRTRVVFRNTRSVDLFKVPT